MSADVADAEAVDKAAERIEAELGPIEIWINAAMATVFGPVNKTSAAEYKRVTEVTYLGFVHGTLAALRYMESRHRGTIVQVRSEEHTSELQSLMRISYAVFCLKKKKQKTK